MRRLNVALVGCGFISGVHIEGFQQNAERVRIVACCDADSERARKAAEAIGAWAADAPRAVSDYAALLADPEVEAVDLCLPHHLHAEMAIAAARAGKHILCEKPLALTPEDCDRMAAAAREAGVTLMHGENLRTAGIVERAAEIVTAGRLGTLVGFQGIYAHWQSPALNKDWRSQPIQAGGGHLIDGGIHLVDVFRHLGGEIASVQAMMTRFRPELGEEVEDTAILNLRFAGGHLGQLFTSHASRGRGAAPMLTVFGTEGCLSLEAFGGDRALVLFPHGQPHQVLMETYSWRDTFAREIAHFLDVVLNGEPLRATPEDGRENLRVVLAAYESARTGQEIPL